MKVNQEKCLSEANPQVSLAEMLGSPTKRGVKQMKAIEVTGKIDQEVNLVITNNLF